VLTEVPQVRYARSGDLRIAYQVFGKGPVDLVYGRSAITHLELVWEEPDLARHLAEIAKFSRVILWDKRGVGLSDRVVGSPTLEDRIDDVRAVMDAVQSARAVIFGGSDTAAMSLLFAATYPERTLGLILIAPLVRGLRAPDYPWVWSQEEYERSFQESQGDWGTEAHIDRLTARFAPSRFDDRAFKKWFGRVIRSGSSPSADVLLSRMNMQIDVRDALPAVHVPTLVLQCPEDRVVRRENSDYVVSHVEGARLVPIPGIDHFTWANRAAFGVCINAMRQFIEGLPRDSPEEDRVLFTVLFMDVVGSTRKASLLGDRGWSELLGRLLDFARTEVVHFRGRVVKTTGDGLLAIFDGPTRATRCAVRIRDHARGLAVELRAGLHTGECLLAEGDVTGIAVHIASRICDLANGGEVLTSRTVRDLSVGSDVRFEQREPRPLKGLEGDWVTYSVSLG
jgi:class 3 adenylate cyclase/pimeloyl-ACP methyl ester carboxylesterase